KARRYQRLRDEIQALDLRLTAGRVEALRLKQVESRDAWQEEAVRREGVTAELDALEAVLNGRKLELLELERELSTAQGGLRDREEARNQAEHQVVLLRERAAGLGRRADEAAAECARMRERLVEVVERETEAAENRGRLTGERDVAQNAAEAAEKALLEVETELRQRREVAADHKQLSLDLFSAESDKRGACDRIRERQIALNERREAAEARRTELETRLAEIAHRLDAHGERRG